MGLPEFLYSTTSAHWVLWWTIWRQENQIDYDSNASGFGLLSPKKSFVLQNRTRSESLKRGASTQNHAFKSWIHPSDVPSMIHHRQDIINMNYVGQLEVKALIATVHCLNVRKSWVMARLHKSCNSSRVFLQWGFSVTNLNSEEEFFSFLRLEGCATVPRSTFTLSFFVWAQWFRHNSKSFLPAICTHVLSNWKGVFFLHCRDQNPFGLSFELEFRNSLEK